jgi:hypothetical protein
MPGSHYEWSSLDEDDCYALRHSQAFRAAADYVAAWFYASDRRLKCRRRSQNDDVCYLSVGGFVNASAIFRPVRSTP